MGVNGLEVHSSILENKTVFMLLLIVLTPFSTTLIQARSDTFTVQWNKTYGPYLAYSVIQMIDGGFAIAGQNASYKPFSPHSPSDWRNYTALLIKTDGEGNVLWEKTYEAQVANSVVQTKDLGYALCVDNSLLKLDAQGNVQWNKTFNALEQCRAVQASDGGYALIGNTKIAAASSSVNSVLIKTDENGGIVWNTTFSTGLPFRNDVVAVSLAETRDKGYAIAGSWYGSFWFAKTDANGNVNFNKTYNLISSGGGAFTSLSKTTDGGYILSGFDYDPTQQTAYYSAWIVKTDSQGNVEWNYHFEQPGFGALFRSIAQTTDGGYIAGGDPALIGLDSSGKMKWNSTAYDIYSISASQDGGFLVAGGLGDLVSPDQEVWVAKFVTESATPPDEKAPLPYESSQFPTTWIVIAVIIVATAGIGLLVYLKKYKH